MSDYEILKSTFNKIGCNFTSSQTLFGYKVEVQPKSETEIAWEFDCKGKFIRVI